MTTLKIMPDLPVELVRYNNDNPNQIIFDERYFIKKIFTSDANIDILASLCYLNIEGFNNHKKIFIDENGNFIYLIAPYLDDYKDTYETIITMSFKDIVALFKIMLERLISAHQKDFNPYDIKYSNYLLNKDNQPVFTDFDFSFYKGIFTGSKEKIEKSMIWLINYDKMQILKLFLQSISSSFTEDICKYTNLYDLLRYFYTNLKKKYHLPKDVKEYLDDIMLKEMVLKEEDYLIESLIKPLEKGLELKM